MPANSSKMIAAALAVAAFVVPVAQGAGSAKLSPAQTSRLGAQTEAAGYTALTKYLVARSSGPDIAQLGAQTEAKGFIALSRYLVARSATGLSAADVSRLGGQTEAQGYRALNTYLAQQAAGSQTSTSAAGFAWRDALIGAAFTTGLFLLGAAAALLLRRRHALPQLRH
jgi:hypothetical protein